MTKSINGSIYKEMLGYGIRYLDKHCRVLNDLNVFPVPDGDTGTNMVMTLKSGYSAVPDIASDLEEISKLFANGVVYAARGNSGVIISQFFRGMSKGFTRLEKAECIDFIKAIRSGYEYAYKAVANPVEGTILTVMNNASGLVLAKSEQYDSIDQMLNEFLEEAQKTLENTPNLLPVLKKAGVVDSGGAGFVYIFEGFKKYFNGETIDFENETEESVVLPDVDYSKFDRFSNFEFGYCTELLLQITEGKTEFIYDEFIEKINDFGESVVSSYDDDKLKLHIHTMNPEKVFAYCHTFGEFLTMKVENMSVQHTQQVQKYLCVENNEENMFSIVAVASDRIVQSMFSEMGADCCILSTECPSSSEFIEAFELTKADKILVFPNSSNSILSAMQAASLYKKAKIAVLNCRSIAECYASLAIVDFECDSISEIIDSVNETIRNIYVVSVVKAAKNVNYGDKSIVKDDFFALSGDDILATGDKVEDVVLKTIKDVVVQTGCEIVTMFYGKNISQESSEKLAQAIDDMNLKIEVCVIQTEDKIHDIVLSFE